MCPGRFQNCYKPVLLIEWECLLWISCPFLTTVCLVGVEESGEIGGGAENNSQLSRSRGAASMSRHDANHEILNFEPAAFMG